MTKKKLCLVIVAGGGGQARQCDNDRGWDVAWHGPRAVAVEHAEGGFCRDHARNIAAMVNGEQRDRAREPRPIRQETQRWA